MARTWATRCVDFIGYMCRHRRTIKSKTPKKSGYTILRIQRIYRSIYPQINTSQFVLIKLGATISPAALGIAPGEDPHYQAAVRAHIRRTPFPLTTIVSYKNIATNRTDQSITTLHHIYMRVRTPSVRCPQGLPERIDTQEFISVFGLYLHRIDFGIMTCHGTTISRPTEL